MSTQLNATFPGVMRDRLRAVRIRQTAFAAGRAISWALTVLIAAVLVSMLIDWTVTLFDTRVRFLLTTMTLALGCITLWLTGWRSIPRAMGWTHAAEQVDERVPQLEERWLTVATLTQGREPKDPATQAMLARVTREAVAMSQLVHPGEIVSPQSLKRPLLGLGGVLVALGIFFASHWGQTSVLWQRFWSPLQNITATQLQVETGDLNIPRGQSVELVASMTGLLREECNLILRPISSPEREERLTASVQNGAIKVPVDVDESLQYRIEAGDGRSDWYTLTAIDFPELKDVHLTVTPPRYVDEPPSEKNLIPSRLRAVQGSHLELAIKPQIELQSLTLQISVPRILVGPEDEVNSPSTKEKVLEDIHALTLRRDDDGWYRFAADLQENFSLTPLLVSLHGLQNRAPRVCQIEVTEDHAPVARIVSPNSEGSASLDEVLDIRFEAHDDHGIAKAELVIYEDNPQDSAHPKVLAVRPIPLGDQEMQKHVMGKIQLDLKELGLQEGTNISYSVRVMDNRDMTVDTKDALDQMLAMNGQSPQAPEESMRDDETSPDAEAGSEQPSASPKQEGQSPASDASTPDAAALPENSEPTPGVKHGEAGVTPEGTPKAANSPENGKGQRSPDETGLSRNDQDQSEPGNGTEKSPNSLGETANRPTGEHPDRELIAAAKSKMPGDSPMPEEKPSPNAEEMPAGSPDTDQPPALNEADPKIPLAPGSPNSSNKPSNSDGSPSSSEPTRTPNPNGKIDEEGSEPVGHVTLAGEKDPRNPADLGKTPQGGEPFSNSKASPQSALNSPSGSSSGGLPPKVNLRLNPQMTEAGQQQETDRRKLRIVSRLEAVASSDDPRRDKTQPIRDKVVQIEKMLASIEGKLNTLYRHQIDDSLRAESFKDLDVRLKEVEEFVTQLNEGTRETALEFVGLQMVDIASSHVTPARDAVFIAIRTPDSGADLPTEEALHHIISARELLQALLKRYDSVVQEQQLADKVDEAVKMYTVYVERSQRLMREAQQNRDPLKLQRAMEVLEVDQAYIDRLAEVQRMRRDMMSELARILADDPRLRSRYLDLIKRRRSSLSNQLVELAGRQDQLAQEVLGWNSVDENQRDSYWLQISDLRLDAANQIAKEAQQLSERIEKQLPLVLDPGVGAASLAVKAARQISLDAFRCDLAVRELRKSGGLAGEGSELHISAEMLVHQIGEVAAAMDRLEFESETLDGVTDYVQRRRIEVQALADLAESWASTTHAVERMKFSELARLDQYQLNVATELLRTEMLDIETDLAGQFTEEVTMPQEVRNLTQELQRAMEAITFNQSAATFALIEERMDDAAAQQELAMRGFENAQELLNKLRRKTAEALDAIKPVDPNIADLIDPTLDQFLAELEREPNIEAQLGIPQRPRNIRVLQDAMNWRQNGGVMLGGTAESAMSRMQKLIEQRQALADNDEQKRPQNNPQDKPDPQNRVPQTEEEKQQQAEAAEIQKMLKERMAQAQKELEKQASDPSKTEEQRRQLAEMARQMSQSLREMEKEQTPAQIWRRMTEADQAKTALEALAKGEQLPDEQWNKLMSTLGDGVGQVTGRVPSEDYRKSIEQYQDRIRKLTGKRDE